MKFCYLLFLLLGNIMVLNAQFQDSVYKKQTLSQTDIQLFFSYYTQSGNHSAVTGGKGTEELSVYAPEIRLTQTFDTTHKILFDAGVDVISSASTDNIDFHISSASKLDARFHGSLGYSDVIKNAGIEIGASGGFSLESDYTSKGFSVWINWRDKSQMNELGFNFQAYFDDLRWGLINPTYNKPVRLIYPAELRRTQWFTNYTRNSCNFSFSYLHVLSRRMQIGFYPGFVFQQGLLSTPFHRVYFNDAAQTERVENLPGKRFKFPLGIQLNSFIGTRWVLRSNYRFYIDNFGILSNTFSIESSIKTSAIFTLSPLFRFYYQNGSKYFHAYAQHIISQTYYTSDFDLSTFFSLQPGIDLRLAPFQNFGHSSFAFNEVSLRYSFYWRSDGLRAHIISTLFDFQNRKLAKRKLK